MFEFAIIKKINIVSYLNAVDTTNIIISLIFFIMYFSFS
jgi:hypothetical protein